MSTRQWIFSNPHRSAPAQELPENPAFETWADIMGAIVPSEGDFEYFVEEAYRLHSAVTSFGKDNIWIAHHAGEHNGRARNIVTQEWKETQQLEEEGAGRYGAVPGSAHSGLAHNFIDDYGMFETFKKNAGRVVGFGGFNDMGDDETSSMDEVIAKIVENGGKAGLLKRRRAKLPLIPINLENWEPGDSPTSIMSDEDVWSLINDEGLTNAYLVQERVTMKYEYRFFVVGGKLITGAGCLVEFSPLDNRGDAFDSRMRKTRFGAYDSDAPDAEGVSPIEDRDDILDTYKVFAQQVAAQMTEELPQANRYVLDVALGADNQPLIVEFNSESNAGFYACVPQLITDAIVQTEG